MSSDWELVRLADCATFQEGYVNPTQQKPEYFDGDVKWLRAVDLNNGFVKETTRTLTQAGFASAGKSALLFEPGTLAISKSGTIGRIGILQDYMCGNRAVINIKVDSAKCNNRFIFYVLLLNRPLVENLAIGSVQRNLYTSSLGQLEFKLPPKHVQNIIAEILGSLDDKIELNRQINQTLEEIAQTIFISWFVDFEPVKAKMAAKQAGATAEQIEHAAICAISGKTPEQLAQLDPQTLQQLKTTAALFPDALVDSELGEIPEGWEVKLNGDVMDVRDGTHDSPKQSETGFPLVTSKHITSGVLDISDAYLISEDDYQKINKRSQVNQGDILLTMIGTVGLSYLVMQPTVNFAIKNVGLFRTSEVKELKNYFYLLLKSPVMQEYLEARMVGTTQKYLSLKTLRTIEMIMPSIDLLRAFNVQINPFMDKIFELIKENESLSQLKDALLPKLLDGSIALKEIVGS